MPYNYSVRGANDDPLYLTHIQISIDSLYLLYTCATAILIAVGRSKRSSNEKLQNQTLYLLFASMFLIGVTTAFSISSGSLILADAYVGLNYQMFKGVFALFYFPGELALIIAILSTISNFVKTMPQKRAPVIRTLYRFVVGMAVILCAVLVFAHFTYAQRIISAVNNNGTLSKYPASWNVISLSYRAVILVTGLHFLVFSFLLFKLARKQPSRSFKTTSFILLFIVSPAIIVHSLFGTTMNGLLFQSLPPGITKIESSSVLDMVSARIDPICFSAAFTGIGWILVKQERPDTNIRLTDTQDPEQ